MNEEIEYKIKSTLFTKEEIDEKVKKLATEINSFYKEKLFLIGILKGAFVFLADLIRYINLNLKIARYCMVQR